MTGVALPGVLAASRRRGGTVILGQPVIGANQSSLSNGQLEVTQFTLAQSGTLTELHGWFGSGTGATSVRIVVYDNTGASGGPGARVAYTTTALPVPAGTGTELLQVGLSIPLAAGTYWVGWVANGSLGVSKENGTGGVHKRIDGVSFTPPPNPFGTPTSSGTRQHSCWGVVAV